MNRIFIHLLLVIVLTSIPATGCLNKSNPEADYSPVDPGLSGLVDSTAQVSNPHSTLGTGLIVFDPESESFEIVPSRQPVIHANIRQFIEDGMPCSDCFKITGATHNPDGSWELDFEITHPWSGLDLLTAFDTRFIMMWGGTEYWPASGLTTQDPDGLDGYVFNADGYTTIFNPINFSPGTNIPIFSYSVGKFATPIYPASTLNPYKDYYSNENRHMLEAGQTVTRTWHFRLPQGIFSLGYAIDTSWELPIANPPVNIPDDFPMIANKPEAYMVIPSQAAPLTDEAGNEVDIVVSTRDWQTSIGEGWIECPELWTGKKFASMIAVSPPIVTYIIPVTNDLGAGEGYYRALVGIEDPMESNPPWDFTTYTFIDIEVEHYFDPCCETLPVADFTGPSHVITGQQVTLVSTSYDPDGVECTLELAWDLNNDGEYGDAMGEEVVVSSDEVGIFTIGLKATDPCGLIDTVSYQIEVHVGITKPEDQDYKTMGTQFSYVSGEFDTASMLPFVDLGNPDGPWDFTGLALVDSGNYRAILAPDDPEVLPFAGNITSSFDYFYKTTGFYNDVTGEIYLAERWEMDPDRLMLVGAHEEMWLGSFNFVPPFVVQYPVWVFTDETYSFSFPPSHSFDVLLRGWGEGLVSIPYMGITDEPCVVLRYKCDVVSPDINGGILVYEWFIDDGTSVALVGAVNHIEGGKHNFDESTLEITGMAAVNALNHIGPY